MSYPLINHAKAWGFILLLILLSTLLLFGCTVYTGNPLSNGTFDNLTAKNLNITGNATIQGFQVNNQTNRGINTCQLSSGTCTISNNRVTADTIILCTAQNGAANLGALSISARTPGTSYTITSSSALEADKVGCLLIEPKEG